jgi:hypothetical protein
MQYFKGNAQICLALFLTMQLTGAQMYTVMCPSISYDLTAPHLILSFAIRPAPLAGEQISLILSDYTDGE